jgi:hypothetical protein
MIVLFDPRRLLLPARVLAWWREKYLREPDRQHTPETTGDWHFIGYLHPSEYDTFPARMPLSKQPYSDPPYDEETDIFQEIQGTDTMPPDPAIPYTRTAILIYGQEFERSEKFGVVGKWTSLARPMIAASNANDAGLGHSLPGLTRRILVTSRVSWPLDIEDWLNVNYPGAEIQVLSDSTAAYLDAMIAGTPANVFPFMLPGARPESPPKPTKYSGLYGIHGRADGGPVLDVEIETAKRAGLWGNPKASVLLFKPLQEWSYEPWNYNGQGVVYANQIVRLEMPGDMPHPPHFYVNGNTGIWDRPIWEAAETDVRTFVLGNEPDQPSEGLGRAWQNAADFCQNNLRPIIDLIEQHYRASYPNMKLLAPAISPQPDTLTWWIAYRDYGILARCQGLAAHAYWDAEFGTYPMESESGGRHYRKAIQFLPLLNHGAGGKLWLTEISHNNGGLSDDERRACGLPVETDAMKGDQYARFLAATESDRVACVLFFVSHATDPNFNARRETWVRYPGDSISDIPRAFAERWKAIP